MTDPKTVAAKFIKQLGSDAYSAAWKALEGSSGQSDKEHWASVCKLILITQDGNYARKNTIQQ